MSRRRPVHKKSKQALLSKSYVQAYVVTLYVPNILLLNLANEGGKRFKDLCYGKSTRHISKLVDTSLQSIPFRVWGFYLLDECKLDLTFGWNRLYSSRRFTRWSPFRFDSLKKREHRGLVLFQSLFPLSSSLLVRACISVDSLVYVDFRKGKKLWRKM